MLEIQWPWIFALLPLPWIFRYLLKPAKVKDVAALKVPFISDFKLSTQNSVRVMSSNVWSHILITLVWVLLIIATARPLWLGDQIELPISGRDLMLAVDLSGSMETRDFKINGRAVDRLTATKAVAGEFIERRVGDRIGLVLFGKNAYLQTPLTFDRETVKTLLYESVIGLAGKETAIGDAVGLAVKRLMDSAKAKNSKAESVESNQILILLTDGANTAGEVKPKKAAELAAHAGLKIYTIGIGADEVLIPSFFGTRKVNPSLQLDEKTLRYMAETTGGQYFRARDINELNRIYKMIDKLQPIEQEKMTFRPKSALYYWPLGMALLMSFMLAIKISYQ